MSSTLVGRTSSSHWRASAASVRHLFRHQLQRTRVVWWSTLTVGLASPTLFLFAIGAGLGSQIDDAELADLGTDSYLAFIGPGILAVTAMQVAATEGMWPTMGLLKWGGVYRAILATPITPGELAVAQVLWIGFRGAVAASSFLLVLAIAGAVSSWWALLIPLVATLIGWVHAAPLVGMSAWLERENIFPMISRVVLFPLFLFSGAFFPVDDMPAAVAALARVTPSWHGVELSRRLASDGPRWVDLGHVVYLAGFAIAGFAYARHHFTKSLGK
jgi:lipooligosaccharide transport system permease protein